MEHNKNIKFAFLGTPQIAASTLSSLCENGYTPTVVVTSPDARSGRGLHFIATPVSQIAEKYNIKCLKPEKIDDLFISELKNLNLDLSIVVAYGKILPENLIHLPTLGTVNIHYSLLPKYRGASPLEQALLHGDTETGVSIQQMAFKLDSGAILGSKEISVGIDETKSELRDNLCKLGSDLLIELLPSIISKNLHPVIQDEQNATYCKKIKKEDGEINPNEDPKENYNKYRAFESWPSVYFFTKKHDKDIRVKITKASYKDGQFIIEKVIPEGKKEMTYQQFLN